MNQIPHSKCLTSHFLLQRVGRSLAFAGLWCPGGTSGSAGIYLAGLRPSLCPDLGGVMWAQVEVECQGVTCQEVTCFSGDAAKKCRESLIQRLGGGACPGT